MLYEDGASIILTVYNQEYIIEQIFAGIVNNISDYTKEITVIIDGCTDRSDEIIGKIVHYSPVPVWKIYTPDLNEVKANNVGLKSAAYRYSIIVQDDCMVTEKNFDKRLVTPFKELDNILAVTGRTAEDMKIIEGNQLRFYNTFGADVHSPRNIFGIRDAVNRGPLMLDNEKLKQLDYLNEDFAPLNQDDTDLCIRGYKQFGYLVGSFWVGFESPAAWGKTRHDPNSASKYDRAQREHLQMIIDRHSDFINAPKHCQDIIIGE